MNIENRNNNKHLDRHPEKKSKFTKEALEDIYNPTTQSKIYGYTWHHHQNKGRMQLVPEKLHQASGHKGGYSLWGK